MGTGIIRWLRQLKRRLFRNDHVLYFCHIPKTYGTTFDRMLRSRFIRELAAPSLENHTYFTNPEYNLENYDFISGHLFFGKHIPELVSRPVRSIVLLREPRALLLSMFEQGMQFEQDPNHHYIKENCHTPELFFNDPVIAAHVANPMSQFLGMSECAFSPDFIKKAVEPSVETAKARLKTIPQRKLPNHELLNTALDRLRQFHIVGLTENLQLSANLVARMEGWPLFGEVPHYNESATKTKVRDLSPEALQAIDKLTELDREIYDVGQKIFSNAVLRECLNEETIIPMASTHEGSERKAA